MGITFEDGSVIEGEDFGRMLNIIKQRAKDGKPKPTEIKSGGVTINVKGLTPNPKAKGGPAHANYIESTYKGWKIRVWRNERDERYCCNYFQGEDCRYFDLGFGEVLDENGAFRYAEGMIDDI